MVPELETAVYRIVQESLTHAIRHGGARRAVIEVTDDEDELRLEVRDDGAGFDPGVAAGGFGLLGMRERAALFGGELTLTSAPGQGATVTAAFPVSRRHEEPSRPVVAAPLRDPT
jgi:signal transduction histidine kinase